MGLRPTPRDRDNLIAAHKDLCERLANVEQTLRSVNGDQNLLSLMLPHYVTGLCLRLNLQVDIERSES